MRAQPATIQSAQEETKAVDVEVPEAEVGTVTFKKTKADETFELFSAARERLRTMGFDQERLAREAEELDARRAVIEQQIEGFRRERARLISRMQKLSDEIGGLMHSEVSGYRSQDE